MKCKKCNCELVEGKAIQNTLTGIPDFPGTDEVVTVSPGGSGKLIKCLKCPKCGYSVYRDNLTKRRLNEKPKKN